MPILPALWANCMPFLTACTSAAGISNNAASWSMIALIAVTSEPLLVWFSMICTKVVRVGSGNTASLVIACS